MKSILRKVVPRNLWEAVRQAKILQNVRRFPRRMVTRRFGTDEFKIVIADRLSEAWYDRDWQSLAEIEILAQNRLRDGALVFDLGAHQGVVAMMLARHVGATGRVIAVEGMAHNCEVAKENAKLNGYENIDVVHAVVTDDCGTARFFNGLNGSVTRDGVGQDLKAVSIDALSETHGMPDVVFVDIEGYELNALRGAPQTLRRNCDWFVEVHVNCGLERYGGTAGKVLSFFPEDRFHRYAWKLDSGECPRALRINDPVTSDRFALVAIAK